MPRICFVLIAGLDRSLLQRVAAAGPLATLGTFKHQSPYQPVLLAVTSTMQATLTTGALPSEHGIICNGLYTHNRPALHPHLDLTDHADARTHVSFWEQSNTLLERPRFWQGLHKKTAMLFWQNSMHGAADIVLTPKPTHTPDGKTLSACFSDPADLYATLIHELGPFPLHNYWSPMAGLPSSQWIARAAEHVWQHHRPDLQLVYIPHLDFNLLRLGPSHPALLKDLQDIDALLAPLAAQVRADGSLFIVAGDYGMNDVSRPIAPNLALRQAGLLATKPDPAGGGDKLLVDYDASRAFAMADHQIAHVYTQPGREHQTADLLAALPGVAQILDTPAKISTAGLANPRSGNLILLAAPDAWFIHDWWEAGGGDAEKPAWQFTVDIHNRPGFDPRELFFDPVKKCIAQNPALVKGSHALIDNPQTWPMLLTDTSLPPSPADPAIKATAIARWLREILTSK